MLISILSGRLKIPWQIVVAVLFFCSGCSLGIDTSDSPDTEVDSLQMLETEVAVPPLEVSIAHDEVRDGVLYARVHIKTLAEVDPRTVMLRVQGLSDGEKREEVSMMLSDVTGEEILLPESVSAVDFTLASSDLSEYQVYCQWGLKPKLDDEALILRNSQISREEVVPEAGRKCPKRGCGSQFVITTNLVNYSDSNIADIVLAIGIFWESDGAKIVLPGALVKLRSNEETLSLRGLKLSSTESKTVRVRFDRIVPNVPGGRFVPSLRLLSFRKQNVNQDGSADEHQGSPSD